MTRERHELAIDAPPDEALAAVAAAAEDWGAEWTPGVAGGRIYLPVVAGLRRGVLAGQIEARAEAGGRTRLTLLAETSHWRVHRSAAAVLVLGAAGALPVLLWPLSSRLLALAPVGLVMMFLAWFMVVSRLRSAGGAEFLETVREELARASSGEQIPPRGAPGP